MQFGELLQNGNFYRGNIGAAEAQYTYTSNGAGSMVRPHFTFYGFRHVKLNDLPEGTTATDFKAYPIHSDLDQTGLLTTSSRKVNKLFSNALWSQNGNFIDVPTDCPQRDERHGFTGDAQIFAGTACFNMDCTAFFAKYMEDLSLEQHFYKGGVPVAVPSLMAWLEKRTSPDPSGWADAATVIPWTVYLYSGDKALLRKHYETMLGWVRRLKRRDDENGARRLILSGFQYGDWHALDNYKNLKSPAPADGTDNFYIASAYYAHSVHLTLKAAQALEDKNGMVALSNLLGEIKDAFGKEFFTTNGRCVVDTQTAHVLALHFDLIPQRFRKRSIDALVDNIRTNDIALTTGFLGTPLILRVLSDNGHPEIASALLLRERFPGWLYAINQGATTIWERWNSIREDGTAWPNRTSLNHYAYGAVVEWMYRNLCGLRPREDAPGFRKVEIRPDLLSALKHARMRFDSPAGLYAIAWKVVENGILFDISVPFGTKAVFFPPGEPKSVKMNGKPASIDRISIPPGRHSCLVITT